VRSEQPALRYGRFYFRPISGNGLQFGVSTFAGGVLAFSRVLNDVEVVVVVNTNTQADFVGLVIVDAELNSSGAQLDVLFTNRDSSVKPGTIRSTGPAEIREVDGTTSHGPACVVPVTVGPMEIQILGRIGL